MSNTINWGKIYEKTAWGIGVVTNTISWGKIYADLVGALPSFALDFLNISNDFTFTRASFATRVNEFGLIETVTDLGSELVVNGSFDTDSDWIKQEGWTISGGTANFLDGGIGNRNIYQSMLTVGKTYELTFTILNYVSGGIRNVSQGGFIPTYSANGTYTETFVATNSSLFLKADINSELSIDNVSVKEVLEDDVPRIDYTNGEAEFLLEPQSTNLLPYSEDFSQWNAISNPTVTLNQAISPDGTNNATLLEFDQTVTTSRIEVSIPSGGGGDWVFSIWAKSVSGNDVSFGMEIGSAGTLEQERVATSEWKRFYIVGTTTSSVNLYPQIEAWTTNNESIYIWGGQLEALPYATSYIPTNGSAVTRSAESCVGATPTINSEEGVLYAEISALADDGTNRVIQLSNGTNSNRIFISYWTLSNEIRFIVQVGGVTQSFDSTTAYDILEFNKIAFKYKENDFALWINGTEVITDTSGITFPIGTLTQLDFDSNGSAPFYGKTKDLRIYDKALTDDELITITSI